MSTNAEGPWLDDAEQRAWRAWRRMTLAVQVRTARDLADLGLSEADYEVLSTLSERPGATSTLREQAAKMGWSRSRLSHHATRMESRGLLRREPDPDDGRGCFLVLAEDGLGVLAAAAPSHVASVRAHLLDRLDARDLAVIEALSRKVIGADEAP